MTTVAAARSFDERSAAPHSLFRRWLGLRRWLGRPLVAGAVVLIVYLALAATLDPRGRIGGDTGGKVAVLRSVDTGDRPHFDVGYWAAADDPEGLLHPLYYTSRVDGRYQQLTTLPMVWAARPLYALGGLQLARLLPMIGGLLCAFAARALAARVHAAEPWHAFWLVALVSPVTIYSLDLWEHTLGLAGIGWGIVGVLDVVERRRPALLGGVGAGLAFGVAASMRTEALVYGAVATAAGAGVLALARRRWSGSLALGAGALGGLAAALLANQVLEQLVLGAPLRAGRAAGVASASGRDLADRVDDAWVTLAGLNYGDVTLDRALGSLMVVGLLATTWYASRSRHDGRARCAAGIVAIAFAARLASGLSFIPGLVPVWPLAGAGAVLGVVHRERRLLATIAIVAMPIVWITQYAGMPGAQWGGRYLFATGLMLAAIATAGASTTARSLRLGAVVLSAAVTASGVLYLRERTHDAAAAMDPLVAIDADIMISTVPFLFREVGAVYSPERRWLTAVDREALGRAAALAGGRHATTIAVVQEIDDAAPGLDGFELEATQALPWVGRDLAVLHYRASP